MQCILCEFKLYVNLVTMSSLNGPVTGGKYGHIDTLSSQPIQVVGTKQVTLFLKGLDPCPLKPEDS